MIDLSIDGVSDHDAKRFAMGIELINQGLDAQEIRNVDFQKAKSCLGAGLRAKFEQVREPFFTAEKEHLFNEKQLDFICYTHVDSTASLKALINKLKKIDGIPEPYHEFARQYAPLIEAMDTLKPMVIKGRMAAKKEPDNPHKISLTCPCCIRKIAIDKDDKIVHHGYTRPGWGSIQGDCLGVGLKPLEVSNEGLKHLLKRYKEDVTHFEKSLQNKSLINEVTVYDHTGRSKTFLRGEKRFDIALKQYIQRLDSDLKWTKQKIEQTQKRLDEWKPDKNVVAFLKKRRNAEKGR